jgi:hypothetical protein
MRIILLLATVALTTNAVAQTPVCETRTGATQNQVVELYTSEGCSSCPPADRWLSTQKANAIAQNAVVQSFHVSYWDYIGWKDRFATTANNARQRQIAAWNKSAQVYTPQIVRDGKSAQPFILKRNETPAQASIALIANPVATTKPNTYSADIVPNSPNKPWAAYWTLTEDGHTTKVKAGENSGELLKHDFVVRQYETVAQQTGRAKLNFAALPKEGGFTQRVNLVVFDPTNGETLQAAALSCN